MAKIALISEVAARSSSPPATIRWLPSTGSWSRVNMRARYLSCGPHVADQPGRLDEQRRDVASRAVERVEQRRGGVAAVQRRAVADQQVLGQERLAAPSAAAARRNGCTPAGPLPSAYAGPVPIDSGDDEPARVRPPQRALLPGPACRASGPRTARPAARRGACGTARRAASRSLRRRGCGRRTAAARRRARPSAAARSMRLGRRRTGRRATRVRRATSACAAALHRLAARPRSGPADVRLAPLSRIEAGPYPSQR